LNAIYKNFSEIDQINQTPHNLTKRSDYRGPIRQKMNFCSGVVQSPVYYYSTHAKGLNQDETEKKIFAGKTFVSRKNREN